MALYAGGCLPMRTVGNRLTDNLKQLSFPKPQLGPLQPASSVAEGCLTSGNRGSGLTRTRSVVSTICA